jgi:hypothetical protein
MKHDLLSKGSADFTPLALMGGYFPVAYAMSRCGGVLCDGYTAMGAEWLNFVNRRLHNDLALQAKLAGCRNPQDCMTEWTSFLSAAANDYRDEFNRLIELNSRTSKTAFSTFNERFDDEQLLSLPG